MRFVGYRTETAPKGRELFVVFGLKFAPLADDRPISRMALSPQPLAHLRQRRAEAELRRASSRPMSTPAAKCPSRAVLGLRLQCGVCCKICSQVFMHGDVVEAAKAVLHFIERREKRRPQLRRFLPGNAVSKNSAA